MNDAMLSNAFQLAAKRHFSESDLSSTLAVRIAEDPDILAIARETNPGAFPPYILLAAVHSLVLVNRDCELAQFFPTVSRKPVPDSDPYPAFRAFVLGAREQILSIIRSAHVNKSVVKRSACLRALLVDVANKRDWGRVHLVDIGCGAGLNLFLDQWRITYDGLGVVGPEDSTVHFSIRVSDGPTLPLGEPPKILTRTGIDLDRFDLADAAQERWLLGCLFPDHPGTFDLTKRALAVLRQQPLRFVTGNAGDELFRTLADLPGNEPVVVMHSLMLSILRPEQRCAVHKALQLASRVRPVARIGMEISGNQSTLIISDPDNIDPLTVGEADDDAAWMCWY